jgi:hypothetical protein
MARSTPCILKRYVIVGSLHYCLTALFRALPMRAKFVALTAKREVTRNLSSRLHEEMKNATPVAGQRGPRLQVTR